MQTKKGTIIEIATGTSIGMVGSWLINYTVVNSNYTPALTATLITVYCTIWSLVRSYFIRRSFNKYAQSKLDT